MATIWTVRDRQGRAVTLTDAGWRHIVAGRAEMAGREDDVRDAVAQADFVCRDAQYPRRECHYRRVEPGRLMLKVIVNYRPVPPQGTWAGDVITAYPTGHAKPKERQTWP